MYSRLDNVCRNQKAATVIIIVHVSSARTSTCQSSLTRVCRKCLYFSLWVKLIIKELLKQLYFPLLGSLKTEKLISYLIFMLLMIFSKRWKLRKIHYKFRHKTVILSVQCSQLLTGSWFIVLFVRNFVIVGMWWKEVWVHHSQARSLKFRAWV